MGALQNYVEHRVLQLHAPKPRYGVSSTIAEQEVPARCNEVIDDVKLLDISAQKVKISWGMHWTVAD